jgi:hypoxanthine phosphoribosyltransferase
MLISTTFQFNKNKNEWKNLADYLKENGYNPGLTVNTYGGTIKGDTITHFCKNAIILVCTIIHYTKNEPNKSVTNYRAYNFGTNTYINNFEEAGT